MMAATAKLLSGDDGDSDGLLVLRLLPAMLPLSASTSASSSSRSRNGARTSGRSRWEESFMGLIRLLTPSLLVSVISSAAADLLAPNTSSYPSSPPINTTASTVRFSTQMDPLRRRQGNSLREKVRGLLIVPEVRSVKWNEGRAHRRSGGEDSRSSESLAQSHATLAQFRGFSDSLKKMVRTTTSESLEKTDTLIGTVN